MHMLGIACNMIIYIDCYLYCIVNCFDVMMLYDEMLWNSGMLEVVFVNE